MIHTDDDRDYLIAFEKAYTVSGKVLVPRTVWYCKNVREMDIFERRMLVSLLRQTADALEVGKEIVNG